MKHKFFCVLIFALSFLGFLADASTESVRISPGENVHTLQIKMPGLKDTVYFNKQPALFTVQIVVGSSRINDKHESPTVSQLHRQVWLLRADGTSIPQSEPPAVVSVSNAGSTTDLLIFTFPKVATDKVAGIVASVNGKLYCRPVQGD